MRWVFVCCSCRKTIALPDPLRVFDPAPMLCERCAGELSPDAEPDPNIRFAPVGPDVMKVPPP